MLQVLLLLSLLTTTGSNRVRRIWSECGDDGLCLCGRSMLGTVVCKDMFVWVQPCYCMYFDHAYNRSILGSCMSTCFYSNNSEFGKMYFRIERLPVQNAGEFNRLMCNLQLFHMDVHREGRFCGQCAEGYGLAVYSYHYASCIPCSDCGYKNWLRYFVVALLPLTVFYFLVVTLRINVTSSYLNGLVLTIQCLLSPIQLRLFDSWVNALNSGTSSSLSLSVNIATSIFGIVNLDFFRMLYPHFCLHPKLNFLHVSALDFIIALYPFLLIFLTYYLVTMYDRNCRAVVLLWKPFRWCLKHYQRQFNVKNSLIETFATFILLSNVKVLGVCFDLLISTTVVDETGMPLSSRFTYYDANIEYFGPAHLPFAILALFAGFLFVLLPFFLLVTYPCRFFQQFLNYAGWRCQVLHIFMDAFQGSYKTEPHDFRYFSAYYMLIRFSLLFSTSYIVSSFFVHVSAFVLVISSFIFSSFRPYKINSHNHMDSALMLLMALFYLGISADIMATSFAYRWLPTAQVMFATSFLVLILYIATKFIFVPLYLKLRTYCLKSKKDTSEFDTFEREAMESTRAISYPSLLPLGQSVIKYT